MVFVRKEEEWEQVFVPEDKQLKAINELMQESQDTSLSISY